MYFEIEERHFFGGNAHVVNSMSVFEFDADAKIRRIAVYLQQALPETAHRAGGETIQTRAAFLRPSPVELPGIEAAYNAADLCK